MGDAEMILDDHFRALIELVLADGKVPAGSEDSLEVQKKLMAETIGVMETNLGTDECKALMEKVVESYKAFEALPSKNKWKARMNAEKAARTGQNRQKQAVDLILTVTQDRMKQT